MNKNATFGNRRWLLVILAIKNEVMMENMDELLQLNSSRAHINTSDYATHEVNGNVGDNSTMFDNSAVIEMLEQIKQLMAENHEEYHAEIGRVRQKSNDLKQEVKEIEYQTSDVQIRLVDVETWVITLEDGMAELGKVLTELKPALSESFVVTLNKRTEEIRDESRRYS